MSSLKLTKETVHNKLVFLGTGGSRYVAFGFQRQAGGLWFNFEGTNIHVDPGPGAFIHSYKKGLEPNWVNFVILSHRHLDHCADVNHILEAMTLGGKRKRGILLCPEDAIEIDPVVLQYTRRNIEETVIIREGMNFEISHNLKVTFPVRNTHGVETYGMIFYWKKNIGYISDTAYFEKIEEKYKDASDLLILNVTLKEPNPRISHLSAICAEKIIGEIKPEVAILTHFGRTMLNAKPWEIAAEISKRTGVKVIAAYDNMVFDLETLTIIKQK
ncbi:metallo-beta-lactamase family protein [Desulfurobacterium thermolithotrophum DSM 11699]|uniref:Metallo-beta-lactamase family protein n=1 Tax=Desulfurobacterium thermolithotrophum (strain DSM 11699 / BSA) TaxID=868864 RepID=F0S2Z7_DESTD|nr:MBL fold metallo-hydrolase [Desulfurobacterium thermolithotrophum]ADY73219.1 metallo-beta-lactamase family protein [Desulfurobacterium thermolithotrophum DSM 11699]